MEVFSFRNGSHHVVQWEGGSARRLAVAELALTSSTVLLTILVALSQIRPWLQIERHGWASSAFRLFATVTPWACYSLVLYIFGIVQSAPLKDDLSVLFACSALLLVGLAESIFCLRSPVGDTRRRVSLRLAVLLCFGLGMLFYYPEGSKHRLNLTMLLLSSAILWVTNQALRFSSVRQARWRERDDLLISSYMANKHREGGSFDPLTMQGYNYIVSGDVTSKSTIDSSRLLTVDEIWHLFSSTERYASECRDVCLSFALFKLLRRRFRGCYLHESAFVKTKAFVLGGLLSNFDEPLRAGLGDQSPRQLFQGTAPDVEMLGALPEEAARNPGGGAHVKQALRGFRIVEVELDFLFNSFHIGSFGGLGLLHFAAVPIALAPQFLLNSAEHDIGQNIRVFIHRSNLEAILTRIVIALYVFLCITSSSSATFSNWPKIRTIVSLCLRRKFSGSTPSAIVDIFSRTCMRFLCSSSISSYWSNTAYQMSLMEASPAVRLFEPFSFLKSSGVPRVTPLPRPWSVRIPDEAKHALLRALGSSGGKLTDGRSSLITNRAEQLCWACHQKFVTLKILVWHVATTICDVPFSRKTSLGIKKETRNNHKVATMLSNYCAYLVAFAPELLADDIYATRLAFDAARTAARERIREEGHVDKLYEAALMMDLSHTDFHGFQLRDVVFQGKMLAAQLLKLKDPEGDDVFVQKKKEGDDVARSYDFQWKVLADFWAELMLFVSPADNAAAHLEKLKTGGELITHIWALLTHAGILRRPSDGDVHGEILEEIC